MSRNNKDYSNLLGRKTKSSNFKNERNEKNNFKKNTKLPIYSKEKQIIEQINNNKVVIISGNTGCGKSTQVPQIIYENFHNCKILMTQPRRIAAISIAKRISFERYTELGELIGYQVSMLKKISKDTKIFLKTTGIFLEELYHNKMDYTHIIIDEVHERDVYVDIVLALLKQFLKDFKNLDIKLILMSATIAESDFANYLKEINENKDVPIIRIEEKLKEVYSFFINGVINNLINNSEIDEELKNKIKDETSNCLSLSYENPIYLNSLFPVVAGIIEKIEIDNNSKNGILIFIPGFSEIQDLQDYLLKYFNDNQSLKFLILHSQISDEDQKEAFKEDKKIRKIILATNIAESSITISNIDYVIDFCLVKQSKFDEIQNTTELELKWCSKASCQQRKGRTGRVRNGHYFQLITKELYKQLDKHQNPEILRTPLDIPILNLKIFDPQVEPEEILLKTMNPPSRDVIINTIFRLEKLGAITNIDFSKFKSDKNIENMQIIEENKIIKNDKIKYSSGKITKVGKIFADLPIDIKYSRLIILSYALGQIDVGIPLAAILAQERSLFLNSSNNNCNRVSLYNSKKKNSFGKNCDFIACYTAYKDWCLKFKNEFINLSNFDTRLKKVERKKYREIQEFTKKNILDLSCIKEILILENELKKRLTKNGMYSKFFDSIAEELKPLNFQNDETEFILKIILGGTFYNQIFEPVYDNFEKVENDMNKNDNFLDIKKQEELFTIRLKNIPINEKDQLIEIFEAIINHEKIAYEYDKYSESLTLKFSNIESVKKILFITSPALRRNSKIPIFRYINKEEKEDKKGINRNIIVDKTILIQLNKEPDYIYSLHFKDVYIGGKILIDKESINLTHIIPNYEELKKTKFVTNSYSNINLNINQKRAKLTSIMPQNLMFDKYMMLIFGPKFEMIGSKIGKSNIYSHYTGFQAYEYVSPNNFEIDFENKNSKDNIIKTNYISFDYLITNYHLKIINEIRLMINQMINYRFESTIKLEEVNKREFEELKRQYLEKSNGILSKIKNILNIEKVKYFREEKYLQLFNYIQNYKRNCINQNNREIYDLELNNSMDIEEEKINENEGIFTGYINEINKIKNQIKEKDFLQLHEPLLIKDEYFEDNRKKKKMYIKERIIQNIYQQYNQILKYMKKLAYAKEAWLICECNDYNCDICIINQELPKIIKKYGYIGVHKIDGSNITSFKPLKENKEEIDEEKINQFKEDLKRNSIEYDDLLCCRSGTNIIGYVKNNEKYIYYESNLFVRYPNLEIEKVKKYEYVNDFKNIKQIVEKIMNEKKSEEFKNKIFCRLCKFKIEKDLNEFSEHLNSEEHKSNMLELKKEFL